MKTKVSVTEKKNQSNRTVYKRRYFIDGRWSVNPFDTDFDNRQDAADDAVEFCQNNNLEYIE